MSDAPSTPIIEVRDLVKDFGGVRAIAGLDLSIHPGELHCIIGPNGAGKSTFFKLLMGIQRPSAGAVFYQGRNVTRLKPFERARLGMAIKFQAMEVYQELTVFQNMFIPLRRHHRPKQIPEQVARLLEQLHLAGTEEDLVSNLSHGEQQWLAIGMSMAVRPEVLLLDEPTAGMSPDETSETVKIVKDLNTRGMTIVVTEHDMAFIRNLDARTSVLHYGKLFAQGSFGEIEQNEDVHQIYLGTM